MKRILLFTFCLLQIHFGTSAQVKLSANFIDTAHTPCKEIFNLWSSYLQAGTNTVAGSKYWDAAEVAKYKQYDIVKSFTCLGFSDADQHMLKIIRRNDSLYEINILTQFENGYTVCSFSVMAARRGNQFVLKNYLTYKTAGWKTFNTAHIRFHFPAGYALVEKDAAKSEAFLQKMGRLFSIPLPQLDFYAVKDEEENNRTLGIESYLLGADNNIGGCIDNQNNIIYSGGRGFYYPHELVHVINPFFPNAHGLFLTGVSGLLGGHFGKPLSWHQPRVLQYIKTHPGIDFNELADFHQVDQYTNPQYVVNGIICEAVIRKSGINGLKKFFSYGREDADYYKAIEATLGIKKKDLKKFIISCLEDKGYLAAYTDF